MASRLIQDLCPALQPLAREFMILCASENIPTVITCTLRSNEEQDALYAQGRTTPGRIITNAMAGQSKHNTGEAFDVGLKNPDGSMNWDDTDPHWQRMGQIGEELGLTWGGRWKHPDKPHFQLKETI
jgi:peptidoglycan L-alanyl-D-glutamate endopeptidase CwlK